MIVNNTYGRKLAEKVAEYLVGKGPVSYSHKDYCGVGFIYVNGEFAYTHFVEGAPDLDAQHIPDGGRKRRWASGFPSGVIAKFKSKNEFIEWLANQNDESLSGNESKNRWYVNNQRITRERLLDVVGGIGMEPISILQLKAFLSEAGIAVADPSRGVGRELSYPEPAMRTIVVRFGKSDTEDYVFAVVSMILQLEAEWLLTPRHGTASDLGTIESVSNCGAILFGGRERQKLVEYLCAAPMKIGQVSSDLYMLSTSGNVLLTWDHHTSSEGLNVQLCQVEQASQLLVALNELGAELEVYYING